MKLLCDLFGWHKMEDKATVVLESHLVFGGVDVKEIVLSQCARCGKWNIPPSEFDVEFDAEGNPSIKV